MAKPDAVRQSVLTFLTPDLDDLFFWEHRTLSRKDRTALDGDTDFGYGAAHPDSDKYPNHKVVYLQHDPLNKGRDEDSQRYKIYYAAERSNQDAYNFEYVVADIGGNKFNAVRRTYVNLRSNFDEDSPSLGTAMADVPTGYFTAANYSLATREVKRIGQKELDSLFVVEQRTYIDRATITGSKYDDSTQGVLNSATDIIFRGEDYSNALNASAVAIEAAVADSTYWGVTNQGKQISFTQISDNAWAVTTADVIPADRLDDPGLVDGGSFGGYNLRQYETFVNYSWPSVLGDDGSGAPTGIEIMDWENKQGGFRNYVRVTFSRHAYRGPCRAQITEDWVATEPDLDETHDPEIMRPRPIVYNSPYLSVSIPAVLHGGVTLQCDIGNNDPTWGVNTGSARTYPPTVPADWPVSLVAEFEVLPFRGGWLIREVTVYRPSATP